MKHIMIDLETLGITSNAAVLTIGAVKFDPFGDENSFEANDIFYRKVDIDSCVSLDLDVNESTIQWWSKQNEEALTEAFSDENRIDITEVLTDLSKFCFHSKFVWSNGAAFDIPILENLYRKMNMDIPWSYWDVRDVRTIFDLGINPDCPKGTKHNADEDALAQSIGVQNVLKELKLHGINPLKK